MLLLLLLLLQLLPRLISTGTAHTERGVAKCRIFGWGDRLVFAFDILFSKTNNPTCLLLISQLRFYGRAFRSFSCHGSIFFVN